MLVSGVAGLAVGRFLAGHSPRTLMAVASAAGAALVFAWSQVDGTVAFYAIWIGIGLVMAAVLYEPAFTVLAKQFPVADERRRAMTAMTLVAALASFIFLPLAQALIDAYCWRDALMRSPQSSPSSACRFMPWCCEPPRQYCLRTRRRLSVPSAAQVAAVHTVLAADRRLRARVVHDVRDGGARRRLPAQPGHFCPRSWPSPSGWSASHRSPVGCSPPLGERLPRPVATASVFALMSLRRRRRRLSPQHGSHRGRSCSARHGQRHVDPRSRHRDRRPVRRARLWHDRRGRGITHHRRASTCTAVVGALYAAAFGYVALLWTLAVLALAAAALAWNGDRAATAGDSGAVAALDRDALEHVRHRLARVDRCLERVEDVLPADQHHRVDAVREQRRDRGATSRSPSFSSRWISTRCARARAAAQAAQRRGDVLRAPDEDLGELLRLRLGASTP